MADNPMDLLNGLLSNPDALKAVGKMLTDSAGTNSSETPVENLTPAISDDTPALPDFTSIMNTQDNGTRLLYALEPYLSEKRKGNINQIVQAVKVGKMVAAMSKRK